MKHDGETTEEIIEWVMLMLAVGVPKDYRNVKDRLAQLPRSSILVLDEVVITSSSRAEELCSQLVSDIKMALVLETAELSLRHEKLTLREITATLNVLDKLHLGRTNVEVHLKANRRNFFVSGMDEIIYSENEPLIHIIDEHPDRMLEIMDLRIKRRTNDVGAIRQVIETTSALSDGAL